MKSRSRGWMRGPLSRGGCEARMLPREPAREPTDPSGRAGVTVLEGRPAAEPERDCPEEDLPLTADLPVLLDERLTPEEERPVLEEDLDALLPVVLRLF